MKPEKRAPAFQFYADDFYSGTCDMPTEQIGVYMLLLCYQWNKGGIPDNEETIRRIARVPAEFPIMLALDKFDRCDDGKLRNPRLEKERQKQEDYRKLCSESGRLGGGNPAFKRGQSNPYYNGKDKGVDIGGISSEDKGRDIGVHKGEDKPKINSPSPSPSPSPSSSPLPTPETKTKTRAKNTYAESFLSFWETYPRKESKLEASRAWNSINPSQDVVSRIKADIASRKQSESWRNEGGKFVPHAATYLRQHRWEDERPIDPLLDPARYANGNRSIKTPVGTPIDEMEMPFE